MSLKRINIKSLTGPMPNSPAIVKTPVGYDLWTGQEFFGGLEKTQWGWNVFTPGSPVECFETFRGALCDAETKIQRALGQ